MLRILSKLISSAKIDKPNSRFITVKMIDNDPKFASLQTEKIKTQIKSIEEKFGYEIEEIIANERYNFIEKSISNCVFKTKTQKTVSEKLDKVFLNKWAAIPIFASIMAVAGKYDMPVP